MTNLPATVQLSTLSREIGDLTERLQPADGQMIAKHLLSLRKAGMAIPNGMKPEDLEAVYAYALSDVPAFGLRRAVEKIIKGEYPIKYGFMPLPPEMAAMARGEARVLREDLIRLKERKASIEALSATPPAAVDENAKARIRSMLSGFRAAYREEKAAQRGMPVYEPLTPEKAEQMARMMALPDAKEITAEQAAYRRRVAAELNASTEQEAAE